MVSRKTSLIVVSAVLAVVGSAGCSALNPKPPIEAFADKLAEQAIIPAVKQGLSQGVEQLTIQAGAQGINPTYVVKFEGKWVTGIEGKASIGVEGIAGQLQVSSSSSEDEPRAGAAANETSPHAKQAQSGIPKGEDNAPSSPATKEEQPPASAPSGATP